MKERTEWHKRLDWRKKFKQVASEKELRVSEGALKILEVVIEEKNHLIESRDHLERCMQALAEVAIAHATEKRREDITSEDICFAFIRCPVFPLC